LDDNGGTPVGTLNRIFVNTWNGSSFNQAYYNSAFTPNNGGSSAYVGWATDDTGGTPIPAPTLPLGNGFFINNSVQTATWSQGLSNGF